MSGGLWALPAAQTDGGGRKRSLAPSGVSGQNIFSSCAGGTLGGAVPCGKVAGLPTVNLTADELLACCSAAAFERDVMWCITVKPATHF